METILKIDPARVAEAQELSGDESTDVTGIPVRAQTKEGKWESVDIFCLDKESLNTWLRSRGGDNPWAEQVVALLLGH